MVLIMVLFGWVIGSYFEAKAFEKLTRRKISVFDAMFIQLVVVESREGFNDLKTENIVLKSDNLHYKRKYEALMVISMKEKIRLMELEKAVEKGAK